MDNVSQPNNKASQNQKKKTKGSHAAIIVIAAVVPVIIAMIGLLFFMRTPINMLLKQNREEQVQKILDDLVERIADYGHANQKFPIAETPIRLGPVVSDSSIGEAHFPTDEDYDEVWKLFNFKLTDSTYYTFYYLSDGKKYKVRASASLVEECDSIFEISGSFDYGTQAVNHPTNILKNKKSWEAPEDCNEIHLESR